MVVSMGFTAQCHIFCGAGKTGNNQKILRIADQFWHCLTAIEHTRLTDASCAPRAEDIAWHDVSSPCKSVTLHSRRIRVKMPWRQSNAASARQRLPGQPDRPWYRPPEALRRLLRADQRACR